MERPQNLEKGLSSEPKYGVTKFRCYERWEQHVSDDDRNRGIECHVDLTLTLVSGDTNASSGKIYIGTIKQEFADLFKVGEEYEVEFRRL